MVINRKKKPPHSLKTAVRYTLDAASGGERVYAERKKLPGSGPGHSR